LAAWFCAGLPLGEAQGGGWCKQPFERDVIADHHGGWRFSEPAALFDGFSWFFSVLP
jgi:hypothetical protein